MRRLNSGGLRRSLEIYPFVVFEGGQVRFDKPFGGLTTWEDLVAAVVVLMVLAVVSHS